MYTSPSRFSISRALCFIHILRYWQCYITTYTVLSRRLHSTKFNLNGRKFVRTEFCGLIAIIGFGPHPFVSLSLPLPLTRTFACFAVFALDETCYAHAVHDWNTRWQSTTSAFCVIRFYKLIPMGQLRIRVEKKRKTGQLFANWAIWHFLHKYTRGYFSFSAQAKSRLMPRKMQTRCYFSFWILREVRGG